MSKVKLILGLMLMTIMVFSLSVFAERKTIEIGQIQAQKIFQEGGYQKNFDKEYQKELDNFKDQLDEAENEKDKQLIEQQAMQKAQEKVVGKFYDDVANASDGVLHKKKLKVIIDGELLTNDNVVARDVTSDVLDNVLETKDSNEGIRYEKSLPDKEETIRFGKVDSQQVFQQADYQNEFDQEYQKELNKVKDQLDNSNDKSIRQAAQQRAMKKAQDKVINGFRNDLKEASENVVQKDKKTKAIFQGQMVAGSAVKINDATPQVLEIINRKKQSKAAQDERKPKKNSAQSSNRQKQQSEESFGDFEQQKKSVLSEARSQIDELKKAFGHLEQLSIQYEIQDEYDKYHRKYEANMKKVKTKLTQLKKSNEQNWDIALNEFSEPLQKIYEIYSQAADYVRSEINP